MLLCVLPSLQGLETVRVKRRSRSRHCCSCTQVLRAPESSIAAAHGLVCDSQRVGWECGLSLIWQHTCHNFESGGGRHRRRSVGRNCGGHPTHPSPARSTPVSMHPAGGRARCTSSHQHTAASAAQHSVSCAASLPVSQSEAVGSPLP